MPDAGYPETRKKWPKVLAFDTSGPFVSIGTTTQSYSAGKHTDMARGQAENLMPMLEDRLAECGWEWADLDVIGVGVGPGNFTGIRISVSAARGLGLALGIPVFGLTAFEIAYQSSPIPNGTLISLPGPRDMVYVQGFGPGNKPMLDKSGLIDPAAPPRTLQLPMKMRVFGHRAREIASGFEAFADEDPIGTRSDQLAKIMAEITEFKYLEATAFPPRPAPNYAKPADAAPARDAPPEIIE